MTAGIVKWSFRSWFPVMLWGAIIFVASSIPGAKLPKVALLINDKLVHALIFFVFGLLVYRALEPLSGGSTFTWKRAVIAVLAVVTYGILDEVHQALVPGRNADLWDAAADTAGGVASALIAYLRARRKNLKVPS